jgi:hypothetical protein
MDPEISAIPTIVREDCEKVVKAFSSRHRKQSSDEQVLSVMQSVYPSASPETFRMGVEIFTKGMLEEFDSDSSYFSMKNKFPQLFISPNRGFFIDDNKLFIDSAVRNGWPEDRAIYCDPNPGQENSIKIAQKISEKFRESSVKMS